MSMQVSAAYDLMAKALDYRAIRQDMIASNIANADTPYYRPRDMRFEDALATEKNKIFNKPSQTLAMAQTDGNHFALQDERATTKAKTFFRDGHMARNDGNSVDLDVETTEMSKNSVMFTALTNAMKKDISIYRSVIDASSKLS